MRYFIRDKGFPSPCLFVIMKTICYSNSVPYGEVPKSHLTIRRRQHIEYLGGFQRTLMNKKFLFGLFGCMLLTILFSACRIVDASTLPKNQKALMGASLFVTTDVTVKKGESLDLVDTV